jgi:transketolase
MALEDLAMMRAVHGSTVLYPSCATTTVHLTAQMASQPGITYMRTTREKTPILYGPDESFPIGGSKTLRTSANDKLTLIAAGITLHECLKAHDILAAEGIAVRVIDLYTIKPIDAVTIRKAASETPMLVTVEDHWKQGGLADAVLEVFDGEPHPTLVRIAVTTMPGSGKPDELLEAAGISANAIASRVRSLV